MTELDTESADETPAALAQEADTRVPNSPELAELWQRIAWRVTLATEPPGASVFRRDTARSTASGEALGVTPLSARRNPTSGM